MAEKQRETLGNCIFLGHAAFLVRFIRFKYAFGRLWCVVVIDGRRHLWHYRHRHHNSSSQYRQDKPFFFFFHRYLL